MPKHLPFILCYFFLFSLLPNKLSAQRGKAPPLEFGKVDLELLEGEEIAAFPNADAVILNDLGRVSIVMLQNSPKIVYTYIRRIKILTEAGKKYAEGLIEVNESEGEAILEFKAISHKINASGDPVSFPISRRKIKEERIKGVKRIYTFEFPFVEEGSIVEYSYQIRGKEINELRPWNFHQEIPVVQSEFQTFIPTFFEYVPLVKGNRNLIYEFQNKYQDRQSPSDFRRSRLDRSNDLTDRSGIYGSRNMFGNFNAFIMVNVPSLKKGEEKEAFSLDTEGSQIALQLKKDRFRGHSSSVVFDNWAGLNKQMLKRYKHSKVKVKKKRIASTSSRIQKDSRGDRAIMRTAYAAAQRHIKWNGAYETSSINVERALNKGEGNASDINMYLYYLLKEGGVDASPVLISTRDHGRVDPSYASLAQFNHIIVLVVLDGEEILLDASSDLERMDLLPQNDLNQFGFILNPGGGRWITLKSHNKVNRVTYSRFTLDDEGQLDGKISVENREYSVVLEQKKLDEYEGKDEEYLLREILIGLKDPTIYDRKLDIPVNDKDPLIMSCELKTGDYVEIADGGEIIILKPMMIKAVLQNPFENQIRNTPVDFPYPLTDSHMIGIRLPKGYEIAQIPAPIRVVLPDNGGSFTFNVLHMKDVIHFTSAIHINQTTYPPEQYNGIRMFFEYVVNKHQEDIVLRKIQ